MLQTIKIEIQEAYRRYHTYAIGEFKGLWASKQSAEKLSSWWRVNIEINSLRRDSKLMNALSKDIEAAEADLGERVKVWMEEVREIAKDINALDQVSRPFSGTSPNKRARLEIIKKAMRTKKRICGLSESRRNYDIEIIKGARCSSSVVQSGPQSGQSIPSDTTQNGGREDQQSSEVQTNSNNHQHDLSPSGRSKEEVESLKRELRYLYGLFKDAEGIEEPNERQKVWVKEMCAITNAAEILINHEYNPLKSKWKRWLERSKVAMGIYQINKQVRDMSQRRKTYDITYDIGGTKGRKHTNCVIQNQQEIDASTSGITDEFELGNWEEVVSGSSTSNIIEEPEPRNLSEVVSFSSLWTMMYTVGRTLFPSWTDFLNLKLANQQGKQLRSIHRELNLMESLINDIEGMGELDEKTKLWVGEVQRVANDAQALVSAIPIESKSTINFQFSLLPFDLPLSKKIQGLFRSKSTTNFQFSLLPSVLPLSKKIQGLFRSKMEYGIEHIRRKENPASIVPQSKPPFIVEDLNLIGFDEVLNKIMDQLLGEDASRHVISIVGMRGAGKTTLANLLYGHEAIVTHFLFRAKVSVPEVGFSASTVLQDIAKQFKDLPEELNGNIEKEIRDVLHDFLKDKTYLIVLDNMLETKIWDSLQQAFPDTSNRSRIICTTRDAHIAQHADQKIVPHKLQLLTDEESWLMFKHCLEGRPPVVLEQQVRESITRCRGLRQAIVNIWRQLPKEEAIVSNWSEALNGLEYDQSPWSETLAREKGLPLRLRRCLKYFHHFPVDFEIPARRLIVLWVAERIIIEKGDNESEEQIAERYLNELIDRNIVQATVKKLTGDVKACCLPDALRELCSPSSQELEHPRYLSDHYREGDPSFSDIHGYSTEPSTSLRSQYRDVVSILSFDAREGSEPGEDIGNFLDKRISGGYFLLLRVLDLEHVFRPKLPKALGKLARLKYLGLRWTYLESLPSFVSKFMDLQVLDMKNTYISTLPGSIWKMQQLRHLYLSESFRSRFVPRPSRSFLADLQTLWGAFLDEDSPVENGLDTLLNLKKLGLTSQLMSTEKSGLMSRKLRAVAAWISKLKYLRSLRLKSFNQNGEPSDLHLQQFSGQAKLTSIYLLGRIRNSQFIYGLPLNLNDIALSASGLTEDLVKILGKLPQLRVLRLLAKSYVGETMHCSSESFPQLQVLKLWKLDQLKRWDVDEGALITLKDLEIRSCTNLIMLPAGLKNLRGLKELKLSKMPEKFMDRIKDDQSPDRHIIEHVRSKEFKT